MKKKLGIIVNTILVIVILGGIITGCVFSPIVGKWQEVQTNDTIEFTSGHDVIIKTGGFIITGTYQLVGSDVVKLNLEGFGGTWLSLFGGDTWQYEISGNTMTIIAAGESSVFTRISN